MNSVGIITKRGSPGALEACADLVRWLAERGTPPLVEDWVGSGLRQLGIPTQACQPLSSNAVAERAELMIVLGGDGTLIYAAGLTGGREVPVLGINMGTLGFLTEFSREEMLSAAEEALAGRLRVEGRPLLHVALRRGEESIVSQLVVNDAVLNKGALARIAAFETRIDEDLITTYRSDGVILSTPTGSTAYAMAAGGPIVYPTLDCLVIAPICPHWLGHRPIVVPAEREVQVILRSAESEVFLTLDGQRGLPLQPDDRVVVRRARKTLQLCKAERRDFFALLRSKLKWGGSNPDGSGGMPPAGA